MKQSGMADGIAVDYPGSRYGAAVPDTLDLSGRAALAINGFAGLTDPELDFLPFGLVHWASRTPHMRHWASADVGCGAKLCESFPMMRLMSGSTQHLDLEAAMRQAFLARVQDGLFWDFADPRRPWRDIYNDSGLIYGVVENEDFSVPAHAARMLRAVAAWYQAGGDPALERIGAGLIRGMRRIAIDRGDYSYYPEKGGWCEATAYPRSGWRNTDEALSETEGPESSLMVYHGHPLYAAAQWHSLTGDPAALELAERLARYCIQPKFWGGLPDPERRHTDVRGESEWHAAGLPDPAYTAGSELGHWYTHFHARAAGLRGLLEYGRLAGDQRILEFVRRAYEYTLTQGIPRIGWINTYPAGMNMCEGCTLGDLTALGIRLSDAGMGDYWDDVDAVARNHLAEQQVTDPTLLARAAAAAEDDGCGDEVYPRQATWDRVIQRTLGLYAGTSLPTSLPAVWSMVCCNANGTQGLYYAWEGSVREDGDRAQVNLLLNRASRLADVDSYLPYEGKVVIHNKGASRVRVRIPAWVRRREIRAEVSGGEAPLDWVGNYLSFDGLKPGDALTLAFPVKETTQAFTVNANSAREQVYTCTFRGSTLVDISPRDERPTSYPIYRREHMRRDAAPMTTVERFVPDAAAPAW